MKFIKNNRCNSGFLKYIILENKTMVYGYTGYHKELIPKDYKGVVLFGGDVRLPYRLKLEIEDGKEFQPKSENPYLYFHGFSSELGKPTEIKLNDFFGAQNVNRLNDDEFKIKVPFEIFEDIGKLDIGDHM